jgi:hypothetical protein
MKASTSQIAKIAIKTVAYAAAAFFVAGAILVGIALAQNLAWSLGPQCWNQQLISSGIMCSCAGVLFFALNALLGKTRSRHG